MLLQGILIDTARRVGTCLIGAVVLWQVAERAGRGDGEAVIHVAEPGAVVMIDGYDYPLDPVPGVPIVCALRPGSHTLSMSLEGRVVCNETFTLDPGGHVVLTARDETRPTPPHKDLPALGPPTTRPSGTFSPRFTPRR
jgi:hypothetical protein